MSQIDDIKKRVGPQVERAKKAASRARDAARKIPVKQASQRAQQSVEQLPRGRMIGVAIALAVVLFLAVNVIANTGLRSSRADLTENNLYSLSTGTRELLSKLEEPLHLRLFLSEQLLQTAPQLAAYANRVKAMLATYAGLTDKITLEVIDPEPFSDEEDRAVGLGINKIRAGNANQELFFGLAATNSTDGTGKIPVFSPDREAFLEYDLTRLIAELGQPNKPVIALIDGIGLSGNPRARQPEQQVLARLKELFQVEQLSGDVDTLPEGTRVVMIVHPQNLSDRTLYTIDQWVLNGGATLAFLDPYAETAPSLRPGMPPANPKSDLNKLLSAWGVAFDSGQVVGDPETAIQTARNVGGQPVQAANLPWMSIPASGMASGDALVAQLSTIIMTSAGAFKAQSDTTKLSPLLRASGSAGLLPADVAGNPSTDPRSLYTKLEQPEASEPLLLAARLSGQIKTAFTDGPPEGSPAGGDPLKTAKDKVNVILVGDADLVMDRNWVRKRRLLGQEMSEAFANNGAFVLNAVEQMVGGVALADLRGRGVSWRPFQKIRDLEKDAEAKYLSEQQNLTKKLQDAEAKLAQISAQAGDDGDFVSQETQQTIDQFKAEMLATRAQLREVRYELHRDVNSLKSWITLLNVAVFPALIAAGALVLAFRRPKRPVPPQPQSATSLTAA